MPQTSIDLGATHKEKCKENELRTYDTICKSICVEEFFKKKHDRG